MAWYILWTHPKPGRHQKINVHPWCRVLQFLTFLLLVVWVKSKSTELLKFRSVFAPPTQRQPRQPSESAKPRPRRIPSLQGQVAKTRARAEKLRGDSTRLGSTSHPGQLCFLAEWLVVVSEFDPLKVKLLAGDLRAAQ